MNSPELLFVCFYSADATSTNVHIFIFLKTIEQNSWFRLALRLTLTRLIIQRQSIPWVSTVTKQGGVIMEGRLRQQVTQRGWSIPS